jgi:hypothetical protein
MLGVFATGCVSAVISTICWFYATKESRTADNAALEPRLRLIARGNRAGYLFVAWASTIIAVFFTLMGFVASR